MGKRRLKRRYEIVKQLQGARVSRNISRLTLAETLGYHWASIGRWERGETQPSFQAMHDWAMGLGVNIVIDDPACPPETHRQRSYNKISPTRWYQ